MAFRRSVGEGQLPQPMAGALSLQVIAGPLAMLEAAQSAPVLPAHGWVGVNEIPPRSIGSDERDGVFQRR